MSKMDNLRAMREARYAETKARGTAAPRPARPAVAPAATAQKPVAEPADESGAEGLCGHRNMSGRTCTREKGHAAKSHRYS